MARPPSPLSSSTRRVQVELGGELPTVLKERSTGPAEAIGIVAALAILLVAFRSVYAMALPLVTAIARLVVGLSTVGLLAGAVDIPSIAPHLGTMIGLGVGIDYALFVLSRHRDNLAAGMAVEESIGRTNATAGQAVVFAGGTVVVAILGLQLAGIPFVAALGWSAALVVAIAVLVAVTLLPAFLAHHPWPTSIGATVFLLLLAVPMLDKADAGTDPESTTHRQAHDLLVPLWEQWRRRQGCRTHEPRTV